MRRNFILCLGLLWIFVHGIYGACLDFPMLSNEPVIDGNADEPAWKSQPWHGDFVMVGTKVKPDASTSFKAGVYGEYLYFIIRADEPDTSLLRKNRTKRDDMVFFDDCVEVMVDAENLRQSFSHIIVNSIGTVYDSHYSQGGMVANPEWNFNDARTAVLTEKDFFQVEMALPLAELGFIKADGKIRFNVARQRHGKAREITSFSPAKGSLQVPDTFADAQIHAHGLNAYAYRLSAPYELSVNDGKNLTGKIQLSNLTGKIRFLEFFVNGKSAGRRVIEANLSNDITFELPYAKKLDLLVEVREKGITRLRQKRIVAFEYKPISMTLSVPAYRDNIYSDEKITAITGTVKISASNVLSKDVKLVFSDAFGNVLSSAMAAENGAFSLPIGNLADGQYKLTAKCGDLEITKSIRKLPHSPGEVRFNKYGVMLVDGKPFTPYGWFRLNPEDGAKDGYNLDFHYNAPWYSDEQLQAYLDRAQKLGLKVATYCYPKGNMMMNAAYKRALSDDEAKLIYGRVAKFSSHPALLAWYIADEPEYEPWLRERLEKVFEICRKADPYHPTIICSNSIDGLVKYQGIGDVSMPDYYPGFLEKGNSASPIGRYGELLAASRKLDGRAQWGVPQGFTWNAYGSKEHRVPDYDELRNMHYQTLVNGHTGIVWYSHELNYTEPDVHIHVKKLLDEMRLLKDLWQNPQSRKEVSSSSSLVAASYSDVNGVDYLVAVNLTPDEQKINLPAPSGKVFFVAGEKGIMFTPENGRIKDSLGRYRTRVYTTNATLAEAFSAFEEREAVEVARKKLHRPGNLAYYRACPGLKFTSSLLTDQRIPLYQLCDGAYSSI
ncbi:MAG: hypothetical protein IJS08_16515, partial [Victivallales bacterium]|nr:hypothetical protein [Victivallales bacterium]